MKLSAEKGYVINMIDAIEIYYSYLAYCISKQSLRFMTQYLSNILDSRLIINGICPGKHFLPTKTKFMNVSKKKLLKMKLKQILESENTGEMIIL